MPPKGHAGFAGVAVLETGGLLVRVQPGELPKSLHGYTAECIVQ
jgi:hypothetical protein